MSGGRAASAPRFPPPRRDGKASCPAHFLSFSRRRIPPQRGRDRPPTELRCANAALIRARRGKQLISALKEGQPSLNLRMDYVA